MKPNVPLTILLALASLAQAKVDLVSLPPRDRVQLTIYNAADLTLARENRDLVLRTGRNQLQFSWENTLIDPTSLEMVPRAQADRIDVTALVYPPRVRNLGLWQVDSQVDGKVPMEISYLTSGLSWRAFYRATLQPDERSMRLEGFVRVTNQSGEDYDNAEIRLVVGRVQLLDEIAALARRETPYGRPDQPVVPAAPAQFGRRARQVMLGLEVQADALGAGVPKEITKEGLSEYFLYTIPGTETIPHGGSKRLLSFDVADIAVESLFKVDLARTGTEVIRHLRFANDRDHRLGDTPIPAGLLKAFRRLDDTGHVSYVGQSDLKYIPVGEEVELALGPTDDVTVKTVTTSQRRENFRFDDDGDVAGYDRVETTETTVTNTRAVPATVQITRTFEDPAWTLTPPTGPVTTERLDMTRVRFTVRLEPHTEVRFTDRVRLFRGIRREDWREN